MDREGAITTTARGAIEVRLSNPWHLPRADPCPADDDEHDRRPQRRRYEEPLHLKVRKQLLGVAESVCPHLVTPGPALVL